MATMHYLFFSIFSVAVLIALGFGDRALRPQGREYNQPAMRYGFMEEAPAVTGGALADIRKRIILIAAQEIGVRESSGQNDGPRVEGYLAYTGLGKGYAWCAAFVSWCYGQVGLSAPRNAWSPALFPQVRRYAVTDVRQGRVRTADVFGIYNQRLGRIDHVGLVREVDSRWLLTVEGNVHDQVLSKRRPRATIYAVANWLN